MKSHDIAKLLHRIARLFESFPNIDLSNIEDHAQCLDFYNIKKKNTVMTREERILNVSTLASLSQVDKREWIQFVVESGLPIEIRLKDASRDVLGKILRFLEKNPDAYNQLLTSVKRYSNNTSSPLLKALDILLRGE